MTAPPRSRANQGAIRPEVQHKIVKGSRTVGQQYNIRENRWLRIDVDLTAAPPKVLANLIAKDLSRARQQMTSQRRRDGDINCWEIYRKHSQEGIPINELGRQACGEHGSVNYNPTLKAAAEAHRKAFRRAQSMLTRFRYPIPPTQ